MWMHEYECCGGSGVGGAGRHAIYAAEKKISTVYNGNGNLFKFGR